MHYAITFVSALLATSALAAPVSQPSANTLEKRHFPVHVKARPKLAPKDAMAKAYRKFGWEIISFQSLESALFAAPTATPTPSNSNGGGNKASGVEDAQEGEVTASPEQSDSEYLSPVTIGGQQFTMDFDTGSSDLWVFSTDLPTSEDNGHTSFDPSKSSSFQPLEGASFVITYGDGSGAEGTVGYDSVTIGGATVTQQAVEIATAVSSSFTDDTHNDGLVGLAFGNINQVQPTAQKTFFENVLGSLDQPVFTADLGVNSATYEFGTIDDTKHTGQIQYAPVDSSQGFWQFESNFFSVNGQMQKCTQCNPGIADTGTSLMLVDPDVAKAYYSQVQGAENNAQVGGYVYPCGTKLPDFGVAVGQHLATIKGADLTFTQVGQDNLCFGGIQATAIVQGSINVQVYGDVFLKSVFAVFDMGNKQFGVAPKANAS